MRPPDAQRLCQYHEHAEKEVRICELPLQGRGRHRWCPPHAIVVRQEQRRARGAADVRRWRSRNIDIDRLRRFIRRQVEHLEDAGYPRAAMTWRFQKSFGDTACGPDTRKFGHTILKSGFHAYAVFELDANNQIDLYAEAYSDRRLPAPPDCIELADDSPLTLWVRDRFDSFNLCPICKKPFWWKRPGDALVDFPLPHPPGRKEHYMPRISQSAPSPPDHPSEMNPGRRVWRAMVQARMPGKLERRTVSPRRRGSTEAMQRDLTPRGN